MRFFEADLSRSRNLEHRRNYVELTINAEMQIILLLHHRQYQWPQL